ncbi:SDR family NAD(P)-dependent oxidoreductase [Brevibacterium aurantiacum]|uniref:SDR family oxidoreductase n=1 Tax=Brevibacterium aurantiacum TaxID=273384 RepID=A0A2A3ZUG0_BREAU|nr:SDR family oxidoreductase [Brevibacterium aurantiacum]PCC55103.1 hypothetical protein CIK59_02770 [Brevibacterium aurantiacum]
MKRLNEKIAIVTGAASGIGAEIARMYAAEGAKVVLADRNSEDGTAVAENINALGGEAIFSRMDLMCKDDVAATHRLALRTYGTVDILVNCAGVLVNGSFLSLTDDDFDIVLSTNLRGTIWTMQEIIPTMTGNGGGSIVNLASISAIWPESNAYFYGASKAAVAKLSKDVAREFAGQGVRVNTLLPGPTDTPLMPDFMRNDPERLAEFTKSTAVLGRLCEPADIAYGAVYLASDEAAMITGQQLVIDAGVTISND